MAILINHVKFAFNNKTHLPLDNGNVTCVCGYRDSWGRCCTQVVAIDAVKVKSALNQFEAKQVCRELNKVSCLVDIILFNMPTNLTVTSSYFVNTEFHLSCDMWSSYMFYASELILQISCLHCFAHTPSH